jgi:hypothetical protein
MGLFEPTDRTWEMPAWMEPYRDFITNTGGNSIESLLNGKATRVQINAPRALLEVSVEAQVSLLERLHKEGLLP